MRYFILFLLLSCSSKDFRNPAHDVLVCSVIGQETKAIRNYLTWPVLYSWSELDQLGSQRFYHIGNRLKVFTVHRFEELKEPHRGLVVWDFELEKNAHVDQLKVEIQKSVPMMQMQNLYAAPTLKGVKKSLSDYSFMKASSLDDINYMKSARAESYNKTFLVKNGMSNQAAKAKCLEALEEDPPQVQEEEEFSSELLKPL